MRLSRQPTWLLTDRVRGPLTPLRAEFIEYLPGWSYEIVHLELEAVVSVQDSDPDRAELVTCLPVEHPQPLVQPAVVHLLRCDPRRDATGRRPA